MEFVLETKSLEKKYKHYTALNGLTMKIPKGSIYGFVGRNGAGKTTLIRLICGLQEPTEGELFLYGIPSKDKKINNVRRRIGAVVETPAIYLDMTAEENIKEQYLVKGLPSYDGIQELLEMVRLEKAGTKKARNFSLGMKQRLAIAIALVGNPDFLILDEPTNGLDPQGIIEIRELILKLNREKGITVLISSHILDELAKIATYYGFIDNGRIIREMSSNDLLSHCRKKTILKISNVKAFIVILDRLSLDYKIEDEQTVSIFSEVSVSKLVKEAEKTNNEIYSIKEREESLESFFLNLIGGSNNE